MMDAQDIYTYQAMRCVSEKEQQQIKAIFTNPMGTKRCFASPSAGSGDDIKRQQKGGVVKSQNILNMRTGFADYRTNHKFSSINATPNNLKLNGGILWNNK